LAVLCSCVLVSATGALVADRAEAQVVEPNGISVPRAVANGEMSLGQYFASQGEIIDPIAGASVNPGVFSPLCGFQASLVLSQSGALAGISWYNVPAASATVAPTTVYPLVPEVTPIDASVASADIRSSPNYQGGLIGFVLTKGGNRVYDSEYQRNALCSNCIQPGYWKMALAYPSSVTADTYYLAFEDWEGANVNDWGQNDGDFNDKVFRITGVRCPGGGKPCDTGKSGLCGQGLTECQSGGDVVCKQVVPESPEVCDGIDNDCNGQVDDGDALCKDGEVCLRGVCVPGCGHGEFTCSGGSICVDGLCVEELCVGVPCDEGRICKAGHCVGPCDGVVCPGDQVCRVGRCVDPCGGVTCPASRVCQGGVCVESCGCFGCDPGSACDIHSGKCVTPGCETQTCDGGTVCQAGGSCVDPCSTAVCPGGGACVAGVCQDPVASTASDAGAAGGLVILGGTGGVASTTGQGGAAGMPTAMPDGSLGGSAGAGAVAERRQPASSGCGCRLSQGGDGRWGAVALFALAFASLRRPLHRRRRVAR
jgi:MYXO-CTERM domain-containing protein